MNDKQQLVTDNNVACKEIEEMAIEIAKRDCNLFEKCPKEPKHNCLSQNPAIMLESSKNYITIATWLYNAFYRNCKDKVVLSKEEYGRLKFIEKYGDLDVESKARKETAREIIEYLRDNGRKYKVWYLISELRKQYRVEVEE